MVNSFTLGMVGLSVDLSQLEEFKNRVIQTVSHIVCCLVQPQSRLGPHQNLDFGFGLVFIENRSFNFAFKTDPALVTTATTSI